MLTAETCNSLMVIRDFRASGLEMNIHHLRHAAACAILTVVLAACGGGGGGGGSSGGGTSNSPPRVTSPTSFEFDENNLVQFVVEVADADGDSITIRDNATGDGGLFRVDPTTGVVTANTPNQSFDFENPLDANKDNVYEQTITLSDGKATTSVTFLVTIRNVDEPPIFQQIGVIDVLENTTGPIAMFTAEDPEGLPVQLYHVSSVSKLGETFNSERLRNAFSMDPQTGILSIEVPFDAEIEGVQDRILISVGASDGTNVGYGGVNIQLVDIPSRVVDGVAINGENLPGAFADYIQTLGDIDQDGIEDFWISQSMPLYASNYSEASGWIVWGRTIKDEMLSGALDLMQSELTPDRAIAFHKHATNASGVDPVRLIAKPAGDVDGDGIPDILIGVQALDRATDADNRTNAAIIFGSALKSHAAGVYDLNDPPTNAQVDIVGLTSSEAISLALASGDFDGDSKNDVVLGSSEKRAGWVIFAPAINRAKASGRLDLLQTSIEDVLTLEMREVGQFGDALLSWASFFETLPDVTGDGRDELVVHVQNYVADDNGYEDAIVVSGHLLATRNASGAPSLNLADPAFANDVVAIHAPYSAISAAAANGDVDADGLADLALVHFRTSGSDKFGSVVFGKTIRSAFLSGENISLDFADPAEGVLINLARDQDTEDEIPVIADGAQLVGLIGNLNSVTFIPSFVDGAGDEVAFGRAQYFARGRWEAGAIFVFRDRAIASASQAQITISDDASLMPFGRKLQGIARYSALGGNMFASDLDGDGIADLSLASATAGPRIARSAPYGAYYMVPGHILREVFSATSASFDLSNAIADESPPD